MHHVRISLLLIYAAPLEDRNTIDLAKDDEVDLSMLKARNAY